MKYSRLLWPLLVLLVLIPRPRAMASIPGPIFEYPQNGDTLVYSEAYRFKAHPLDAAQGYLWGFSQNGILLWENLRDEGTVSTNEYTILPGSIAADRFNLGDMQVSVRALANGEWTDSTVITVTLRPIQVPILVLAYYPPDSTNPALLDSVETGWSNLRIIDMQAATQGMITAGRALITEATRYHGYKDPSAVPYLEYAVYDYQEFFLPMPRGYTLGGLAYPKYFGDTLQADRQDYYFAATAHRPNYGQIMRDLNICEYVDNHGIKEVWIYGYHSSFIVPDESKMSSNYGDISNAYPKDEYIPEEYRLPRCVNSYVMYNFTYQPGGADAIGNTIHNRLHQIENVIFYAENRGYPVNNTNAIGSTFWDDFSVYGDRALLPGYRASCGNTHSPPNTTAGYDYTSTQYRENNCETWHPDDTKTSYVNANCAQWGCTDIGFYKWFMQNIPGYNNGIEYQGRKMRNWWDAMNDFNGFIATGRSLYEQLSVFLPLVLSNYPGATATSTATSTVILPPTYTPTQTATRTITPTPSSTATSTSTPTSTPSTPPSAPTFIYPVNGRTLSYAGDYEFMVEPVPGANPTGYLWGFFQGGVMVWENLRDEGQLSTHTYEIQAGTAAHERFVPGDVQVLVRASNQQGWSEAASITIHLQ